MSLKNKLAELKANLKTEAPGDAATAFQDAAEKLIAAEQAGRLFKVGDRAPAFTLPDLNGIPVSSAALLRNGPLVVTFYRGIWCPYCQRDLQGLQQALPDIRSAGTSVVAISHEVTSESSRGFQQANNISFPVLDDDVGDSAVRFGIRWAPDDFRVIQEQLGTDLISFHDTDPWILPMQARYVVAEDGTIAFAEVAFDYSQRSEPSEILPVLARLKRDTLTPESVPGGQTTQSPA